MEELSPSYYAIFTLALQAANSKNPNSDVKWQVIAETTLYVWMTL